VFYFFFILVQKPPKTNRNYYTSVSYKFISTNWDLINNYEMKSGTGAKSCYELWCLCTECSRNRDDLFMRFIRLFFFFRWCVLCSHLRSHLPVYTPPVYVARVESAHKYIKSNHWSQPPTVDLKVGPLAQVNIKMFWEWMERNRGLIERYYTNIQGVSIREPKLYPEFILVPSSVLWYKK
jgi:hypothetical protein